MVLAEFVAEIDRLRRRVEGLQSGAQTEMTVEDLVRGLEALSSAEAELGAQRRELLASRAELQASRMECEFQRLKFRELFTWVPRGCLTTDRAGTIEDANHAAGELLGSSHVHLLGKSLPHFVRHDDRNRFVAWLHQLRPSDDPQRVPVEEEFWCRSLSPAREWRCLISVLVLSSLPCGAQLIWFMQDLGERDGARESDLAHAELERKNEFMTMLGHELRNPLAAILLATDVLTASEAPRSERASAARVIRRQAEQLGRLVDDLLEISRARYGKVILRLERLDLRQTVSAAVEATRAVIEHNEHIVATEQPDDAIWVDADAGRLQQVIANLLDNACKYTPSGGHIEIGFRREGERAVVAVRDDGIGIASENLESIFDVFEQAGHPEDPGRGLGLGLALVRQLIELHGGSVRAHSRGPGCGSEFTLELPLAEPPSESGVEVISSPADLGDTHGARILIVDDDPDTSELLGISLERMGYEPVLARSGSQALERASDAVCDVALVDLGLPDINGFELARRLLAQCPEIILVALTGFGSERSRNKAAQAGFLHYLLKPAAVADIRRIVERATGSSLDP